MIAIRAFREAAAIGLIALLPASISWARRQASSKELAPYEVILNDKRLSGSNVVWVDARAQTDYDNGHITGAVLLNEENWDFLLGGVFEVWQPDKPIVVYCNAGCQSSEKVAQRLRDMGMEPVYFLRDGYEAWKKTAAHSVK